jgi:glycosyltransferase involved in cell wall biosynthesis
MKDYGLVSIITPSYNSAFFIEETINSILSQTYTNWELLITDDCSLDNTEEIVNKYMKNDHRIKFFKLDKNSGAGVARNNSIENAQGRFLAFCDSDDCWYPKKLEIQLAFMVEHNYEFSYTSYDTCNEENKIIGYVKCKKKISYYSLLKDNGIGCLTSIYDTARIGKAYMPTIRKRQDWGLWLSVIKKTSYAYGLQESLAKYRIRENSISANKISMIKYNYKLYNKVEGFSKISSFFLLFCYFLPYYFYKKIKQKIEYTIKLK